MVQQYLLAKYLSRSEESEIMKKARNLEINYSLDRLCLLISILKEIFDPSVYWTSVMLELTQDTNGMSSLQDILRSCSTSQQFPK